MSDPGDPVNRIDGVPIQAYFQEQLETLGIPKLNKNMTMTIQMVKDPQFSVPGDYNGMPPAPSLEQIVFHDSSTYTFLAVNYDLGDKLPTVTVTPQIRTVGTGVAIPSPSTMKVSLPSAPCNPDQALLALEDDVKEIKFKLPISVSGNWTPQQRLGHILCTIPARKVELEVEYWEMVPGPNCGYGPLANYAVMDLSAIRERVCDPNAQIFMLNENFGITGSPYNLQYGRKIAYINLGGEAVADEGDGFVSCIGGPDKAPIFTGSVDFEDRFKGIYVSYTDQNGNGRSIEGRVGVNMSFKKVADIEHCQATLPNLNTPCTIDDTIGVCTGAAGNIGEWTNPGGEQICAGGAITLAFTGFQVSYDYFGVTDCINCYNDLLIDETFSFSETLSFGWATASFSVTVRIYNQCGTNRVLKIQDLGSTVTITHPNDLPNCVPNPSQPPCNKYCSTEGVSGTTSSDWDNAITVGEISFEHTPSKLRLKAICTAYSGINSPAWISAQGAITFRADVYRD